MRRTSWSSLAAASAVASALAAAPSGAAPSHRCAGTAEHAIVARKHRCLAEGAACRSRLDRAYHRYLFHCHRSRLEFRWDLLRRPLRIPAVGPGAECPTAAAAGPLSAFGVLSPWATWTAWGPGPAFATGLGNGPEPVLEFDYPPPLGSGWEGSGWGGSKNIWVIGASYGGPVLVRGRQLDGANGVRFQNGRPAFTRADAVNPPRELKLYGPELRGNPSVTRLRAAGCYAFQVDGLTFSYLIVFEARIRG